MSNFEPVRARSADGRIAVIQLNDDQTIDVDVFAEDGPDSTRVRTTFAPVREQGHIHREFSKAELMRWAFDTPENSIAPRLEEDSES